MTTNTAANSREDCKVGAVSECEDVARSPMIGKRRRRVRPRVCVSGKGHTAAWRGV